MSRPSKPRPRVGDVVRFVADTWTDPPLFLVAKVDDEHVYIRFPGGKLVPYLDQEVVVIPGGEL